MMKPSPRDAVNTARTLIHNVRKHAMAFNYRIALHFSNGNRGRS